MSPSDTILGCIAHTCLDRDVSGAKAEYFALLARLRTVEAERNDWRLTVWEHLVTDLTDDGTTSAGYGLGDVPHDVLRGYVVDASGDEARVEAARLALETLLDWAERYRGLDKELDSEEWYIARDAARAALAVSGNQP